VFFGGSGHTALTGIIKSLVVLSSNAMFFKDSRVLSKLFLFFSLKIYKGHRENIKAIEINFFWLIDCLVSNTNFSSISALSCWFFLSFGV
jgi:hypothetical protein